MSKARKKSVRDRVQKKQQRSVPAPASAPLRVEPLLPPPAFETPVVAEDESVDEAAQVEALTSIAPVATTVDEHHQAANDDAAYEYDEPPARPWRRVASAAIALATIAAMATGVKVVRTNHARTLARAAQATQAAAALEHPVAIPVPQVEAPPPAETVAAPAPEALPVPAPTAAPVDVADDHAKTVADAKALRDQALDLLKRAKNPEAMATASKALDADPSDAMPYLVLGSALQDAGRWREATRAYELCVKTATKGMVDECRAMIRRR